MSRVRAAKRDADVRRIVEAESLNEKEIREVTGLTEALSNRLCTGV